MRRIHLLCIGAAALLAGSLPAHAETTHFLTDALKGDNSEIRLGALAAKRGASAKVRAYGAMLERDHRKARQQAIPVARRHGVAVPTAMMDEAQQAYSRFQHLRGPAFDRAFAAYMADDHRKDVAEFEKEAASGDPADVRALAKRTLPVLRKHLAHARGMG